MKSLNLAVPALLMIRERGALKRIDDFLISAGRVLKHLLMLPCLRVVGDEQAVFFERSGDPRHPSAFSSTLDE